MRELTAEEFDGVTGGNGFPLVAAFFIGYEIGTELNESLGISDAIVDALSDDVTL